MSDSEYVMTGARDGHGGGNDETKGTTESGTKSGQILNATNPQFTAFLRLVQKVELSTDSMNEEQRAIRAAKAALARATRAKELAMAELANARTAYDVFVCRRERAIERAMKVYTTLPVRVQSAALSKASSSATDGGRVV